MSDVEARVKHLIANHLGVLEDAITLSMSLTDDLGADDHDRGELFAAICAEFDAPDQANELVDIDSNGDWAFTNIGKDIRLVADLVERVKKFA